MRVLLPWWPKPLDSVEAFEDAAEHAFHNPFMSTVEEWDAPYTFWETESLHLFQHDERR